MVEVSSCGGAAAAIADYYNWWYACFWHRHFWPCWAFTLPLTDSACYEKAWRLQIHILRSVLWLR